MADYSSQASQIDKEISSTRRAIKNFNKQGMTDRANELNSRLNELIKSRDDLINTGNENTSKLINIQEERKALENQPNQQSAKDVVYNDKGQATSKAYALQSQAERVRTAQTTATFISSKDLSTDRGQNGRIYNGGNIRIYSDMGSNNSGNSDSSQIYNSKSQNPQGYVRPTAEVFGKPRLYERVIYAKEDISQREARGEKVILGDAKRAGLGVVAFPALLLSKGGVKQFLQSSWQTVTNPVETIRATGQEFVNDPFYAGGQLATSYGLGKLGGAGLSFAKTQYIKTGATYVPESKVFSSQVLTEGKKFPTASSTAESLRLFNRDNVVSTASPNKLSSKVVGEGNRASLGWEDSGIYVTPKGEGSPAFLGINKNQGYSFTFNPVKPIKEYFSTPSVTEFQVKGVSKLPRNVVSKPGFEPVKQFFEQTGSKTGKAYITKRSELGQGELPKQKFYAYGDKVDKLLGNKRSIIESGTTELEAVVPYGAKFEYTPKTKLGKFKGFDEYTMFEGRAIPIRKTRLIGESDIPSASSKVGSVRSAYSESSRALSSPKYVSPVSSLKYVSSVQSSSIKPMASSSSIVSKNNYLSSPISSPSIIRSSSSSSNSASRYNSNNLIKLNYGSSNRKVSSSKTSPVKVSLSNPLSNLSSSNYNPRPKYSGLSKPLLRIVPRFPKNPSYNRRKITSKNSNTILRFKPFSSKLSFKEPKRRLDILPSLGEVFRYEYRTGKEAKKPRKTKAVRKTFEDQYFGRGSFGKVIPVYQTQRFKL